MPVLSIIVPVYNKINFIDECVASILKQTYNNFELILVDDGSTDGSGDRCKYYQALDSRVVVYTQKNKGVSEARNVGLFHAGGNYIGFVDSDDRIDEDMYEILINNILTHDADISICGIRKTHDTKTEILYGSNTTKIYGKIDAISALLRKDFQHSVYDKIYRSGIAKRVDFAGTMNEDVFFNFSVINLSSKVVYHDIVKYNYIIRDNSISMSKFSAQYMQILEFSEKILEFVELNTPQLLQEAEYYYFVNNISLLNLILLSNKDIYINDYASVVSNLEKMSKSFNKKIKNSKHMYAYRIFNLSPIVYTRLMKLYCLLTNADLTKRI